MKKFVNLRKSRWLTIVPICLGLLVLGGGFSFWLGLSDNRGYAPEQPIPFSHKKHASQLKIDCQYCHTKVDEGRHATIPSMSLCLNCHQVVKPDSPYIQKMKELAVAGKSFEWVKVHDMPDFVFFNHRPHIAKGVDCTVCHGDVANMTKVEQAKQLNMGFCIDCHRQNNAPTSCDTCHH